MPTLFWRRNRIKPDGGIPFVDGSFTVTQEEQDRWFDLFDVDSATDARNPPFSYGIKSATMWFLRTLRSLGINFRHVRQVAVKETYHPLKPPAEAGDYTFHLTLSDIYVADEDRPIIVLSATVKDRTGSVRSTYHAHFMVLSLDSASITRLREHPSFGRGDSGSFIRQKEAIAKLKAPNRESVTFQIAKEMGVAFARLGGDYNFHIYNIGARFMGYPKAFVQGSCIMSYAQKYLTAASPKPLTAISVNFVRPVFVGDAVEIRYDEKRFEFINPQGKLTAFGYWECSV
ncbi:MAG: MaoC family dehydratase [Trebonia sp.]